MFNIFKWWKKPIPPEVKPPVVQARTVITHKVSGDYKITVEGVDAIVVAYLINGIKEKFNKGSQSAEQKWENLTPEQKEKMRKGYEQITNRFDRMSSELYGMHDDLSGVFTK